ncbi:hypothetical protein DFH07DRAFT_462262 [Mycena maculata]|uniref:Uncharacterized protein n=1 Tax=Mycena maculata TaxID=230809 RepID=A0AAD7K7P3_9AGAR|nr:hypothetical protein DFH07DRAFT_462262 [Mycena maculata]
MSQLAGPQVSDHLASNSQLCSIVAVAVVFYRAPSPLQIGHVLDISWEDVRRNLLSMPELFGSFDLPEDYYSEVHICHRVRNLLSQPDSLVNLPKWHAFVARWCLRSNANYDARDIFYANDFWAHHLCRSRPSQDLWDALRRSPVPCRLNSHAMLPSVIEWLETVDVDDCRELISIYRNCYRQRLAALAAGQSVNLVGFTSVSIGLSNLL